MLLPAKEEIDDPSLKKTQGCMRCYDEDIKTLKSVTDGLEANDELEVGGKLNVYDDLANDNGIFSVPETPNILPLEIDNPIDVLYVAPDPLIFPIFDPED